MTDKIDKKSNVGRPPIWKDPIELKSLVYDYFHEGDGKEHPTLAGLAYALKIDRQTLYNYAKKDEFFDIIKEARDKITAEYEKRLVYATSPTGVIFALKNMGWADSQKVDHTSGGQKVAGFNYVTPKDDSQEESKEVNNDESDSTNDQTNKETA